MRGRDPTLILKAGPIATGPTSYPWEAFIPDGNPYLGQAIAGEPIRHCNVLSPDRRPP